MEFKDYLESMKKQLSDRGSKEGEYCIIMHRIIKKFQTGEVVSNVAFVYKDIDTFEKKGEKDMATIDTEHGITLQPWIFD